MAICIERKTVSTEARFEVTRPGRWKQGQRVGKEPEILLNKQIKTHTKKLVGFGEWVQTETF